MLILSFCLPWWLIPLVLNPINLLVIIQGFQVLILVLLVGINLFISLRRVKVKLIKDIGILILVPDSSFPIEVLLQHLFSLEFLDLLHHSLLVLLSSKYLVNYVINLVTLLNFVIQNSWNDKVVSPQSNIQALNTISSQSSSAPTSQIWLTNSGATNHMTADFSHLSMASPYPSNETVQTANGEGLQSHREDLVQKTMQ
ncbi:uncharacterized protein LOC126584296 [Malus sylvestris]|uniref:uncharacterized protein LOC126584296 n=1 Tax=Malus sylvestris TaxID=3752 RepID=UPI0021AC98C7|nr:uncharacterized protein LOC126584296 [Malus sylvestris]